VLEEGPAEVVLEETADILENESKTLVTDDEFEWKVANFKGKSSFTIMDSSKVRLYQLILG
jgi:hypothetical protein